MSTGDPFPCCYLPQPPRLWSRVQNAITFYNDGQTVFNSCPNPMIEKGNILQYKANSSRLTQKQRYSQMAKGCWTNRNTTWATQNTRGYTNPNSCSLKRVNQGPNLAIDLNTGLTTPTRAPVNCTPNNDLLVIADGGNLLCNVQENVCTGEETRTLSQQLCNPTTDSDVPGRMQMLCWNDGRQTWFPRQRYVMTNSGNKWPYSTTSITYVSALHDCDKIR